MAICRRSRVLGPCFSTGKRDVRIDCGLISAGRPENKTQFRLLTRAKARAYHPLRRAMGVNAHKGQL